MNLASEDAHRRAHAAAARARARRWRRRRRRSTRTRRVRRLPRAPAGARRRAAPLRAGDLVRSLRGGRRARGARRAHRRGAAPRASRRGAGWRPMLAAAARAGAGGDVRRADGPSGAATASRAAAPASPCASPGGDGRSARPRRRRARGAGARRARCASATSRATTATCCRCRSTTAARCTPLYPEPGASLPVARGRRGSAPRYLPDSLELTGTGTRAHHRRAVGPADRRRGGPPRRARRVRQRASGDITRMPGARAAGRAVRSGRSSSPEPVTRCAATRTLAARSRCSLVRRRRRPRARRGCAGSRSWSGNDAGGGDTRAAALRARRRAQGARHPHPPRRRARRGRARCSIGASASQLLSALVAVERRAAEAAPPRRAHGAVLLLLGPRQGRRAAPGRDARSRSTALKARIAASPVDVRIAILDSCRSGALTRTKGARKAPAFEIQSESPRDAKGLVILTSSTSDEDSQESDAIGGSYFSHHLASGLLGGADRSGDGRVTLFEAYAYAYDRTVADTAESAAGAQHPTFSYDLAGNGDLVLTDVAVRHEGVYLPREAPERGLLPRGRQGLRRRRDQQGRRRRPPRRAGARPLPRQAAPARPPARRRDRGAARPAWSRSTEARLRDAPFSDDPVKGAGRVDLTSRWSLGAGATYQSVFAAPTRRQPVPADRHAGRRLVAAQLLAPRLGVELRPRRPARPTASCYQRRRAVPVQRGVAGVVAAGRVAAARYVTPFVGGRLAMLLMGRRFDDDVYPRAVLLDAVARRRGRRRLPRHERHQPRRARPRSTTSSTTSTRTAPSATGSSPRWCPMTCKRVSRLWRCCWRRRSRRLRQLLERGSRVHERGPRARRARARASRAHGAARAERGGAVADDARRRSRRFNGAARRVPEHGRRDPRPTRRPAAAEQPHLGSRTRPNGAAGLAVADDRHARSPIDPATVHLRHLPFQRDRRRADTAWLALLIGLVRAPARRRAPRARAASASRPPTPACAGSRSMTAVDARAPRGRRTTRESSTRSASRCDIHQPAGSARRSDRHQHAATTSTARRRTARGR